MKKRVYIDTPMPTTEEVAKRLGIGKARQKRIAAIARDAVNSYNAAKRSTARKPSETKAAA